MVHLKPSQSLPSCSTSDFGNINSLLDAVDLMEARHDNEMALGLNRHQILRPQNEQLMFSDYSSILGNQSDLDDDSMEGNERRFSGCTIGRKGMRKRISATSVRVLNDLFDSGLHFPSREEREKLSKTLSLDNRTVQIWFQNKRQAYKNKRNRLSGRLEKTDENMMPVMMTKLRYDKAAHQLVETKAALRIPTYLAQAQQSVASAKVNALHSQYQRHGTPIRIENLTRIDARLPRPNVISQLSPLMQQLSRELPKLQKEAEAEAATQRLPSICLALRRSSVY